MMPKNYPELKQIQELIIEMIGVERNHFIPKSDRHENVVEHSFSLAMLCWRIFEILKPQLDITKIFKYALIHDFSERGLKQDVNTYAKESERRLKKDREDQEITKLCDEFKNFQDLPDSIKKYELKNDDESLFVWSVDKMQSIILGEIDNWRPYERYGVTYKQFCDKGEEFLKKCSPFIKNIFSEILEEGKRTYYDNPGKRSEIKKPHSM